MNSTIKLILIISIILNFLFAGLVIGNYSGSYVKRWDRENSFRKFARELPADRREMVIKKMGEIRDENIQIRKQIDEVKEQLIDIIESPRFDAALYDRKVNEMHELYRKKARNIATAIKDMAEDFTPEEREKLGDFLEKRHNKHKKIHENYREKAERQRRD